MMFKTYIHEFCDIISNTVITDRSGTSMSFEEAFIKIKEKFDAMQNEGSTIYLIGNGGSSGIISHVSVDLMNTCKIKAVPLTDNSQLTCFANDYGYENIFSKQLETYISPGDTLIAVSSSGNSRNILNAVSIALNKKVTSITFSGFSKANSLRKKGDINLWINSSSYGMVEIGHALLFHYLTDLYADNKVLK